MINLILDALQTGLLIAAGVLVGLGLVCALAAIVLTVKNKNKQAKEEPVAEPAQEPVEDKPVEVETVETVETVEDAEPEPVREHVEETVETVEEVIEEPVEEPVEEAVEAEAEPVEVESEPVEETVEEAVEETVVETAEPEPVAETAEHVETEKVEEPEEEEAEEVADVAEDFAKDEETDTDQPIKSVARIDGHVRYIIIKYKKSFTAKLIQSDDVVKNNYSVIKNELLSYEGVKSRMSWKCETFYSGRTTYAKLCIRGKSLGVFLAVDPKKYADSKYIVDDMSEVAAYEKTPCLYRIKNARRLKYSADLIADAMQGRGKSAEYKDVDWVSQYPYEEIEPLIERKLVKVLTEEDAQSGDVFKPRDYVAATEVNELLPDSYAMALVEDTDEVSDRTKSGIVNIDTLSKYFEDGETVTLEEIKKRVPKFVKTTTCIKVLARGVLDKKLTVIADNYSTEAIKMILLTGGNAIRKKSK